MPVDLEEFRFEHGAISFVRNICHQVPTVKTGFQIFFKMNLLWLALKVLEVKLVIVEENVQAKGAAEGGGGGKLS